MNRKILLSFDVEEFDMPLEYGHPMDLTEQMAVGMKGLDALSPILNEKDIIATLFTTAHFADYFPAQIAALSEKHEIASHTYFHSQFDDKDLAASKAKLEDITGKRVYGLRMPRMKAVHADQVRKAGYTYDASIHPTWLPGRYNNLGLPRLPYVENKLLRIPASVSPSLRIPLFWLSFKNFPFGLYNKLAIRTLKHDGMLSLYYHPWEFVDISNFGLPAYTRRLCGAQLIERLQKLLNDLKKEGDFVTMQAYADSLIGDAGVVRRSRSITTPVSLVE